MDFRATEAAQIGRQSIREFAEQKVAPHVTIGEGTSEIQRLVIARHYLS